MSVQTMERSQARFENKMMGFGTCRDRKTALQWTWATMGGSGLLMLCRVKNDHKLHCSWPK